MNNAKQRRKAKYHPHKHPKAGLEKFCNQRDLTRTSEDACYIARRDYDSRKPFKYVTYNYHPYGCDVRATCYPGQFYEDGHVSGCTVDDDSDLKLSWGNKLTNANVHQELPALPVILPRIRGCFHADVDSDLRFEHTNNWKPCSQLSEIGFNPYRLQFFDNLCFNPQETKHIIQEDTFRKAYQDPRYHYAGQDTRHSRLERYRTGCSSMFNRIMDNKAYVPYASRV
jgi:hypothetical protein